MSDSKKERLHGSNREGSKDPSFLVETFLLLLVVVVLAKDFTIQFRLFWNSQQSAWATTPAEILF